MRFNAFKMKGKSGEEFTMCDHCFLSQLPGVVFGIVTLIWIVGAFGLLKR